ncbi:PREDICTED: uncharacterized protein LOC104609609 [Nelumbo nucifera]|uniref:DC1 domain-containing protein n=2 Tax=Nelumbo nucifera TaxID=4432 RepID=A0A822Z0S6_NELNU|nr:PREDICTED: uncharacterized protein LOC104609609 [Nelumbo nucifera]DAD36606.1 TPA_asm: hypothetical protein HUJ06_007247 [Nelumbo nucifera]
MGSAAETTRSLHHVLHDHVLVEVFLPQEFRCNGCRTLGIGLRYRCHGCDFDLHLYCSTCPMTLPCHMHSDHPLSLLRQPQGLMMQGNGRLCNVCRDSLQGIFYACPLCDFDAHPICTQLPSTVKHAVHPQHILSLQPGGPNNCSICGFACNYWRYGCAYCHVHLHFECVLRPPRPIGLSQLQQPYHAPPLLFPLPPRPPYYPPESPRMRMPAVVDRLKAGVQAGEVFGNS